MQWKRGIINLTANNPLGFLRSNKKTLLSPNIGKRNVFTKQEIRKSSELHGGENEKGNIKWRK